MIRYLLLAFALSSTMLTTGAMGQTIRYVPNNYDDPADAIAASNDSDIVVITSNEFSYEPFTVDKAVEVKKETNVGEVIIDATGSNFAAKITHSGGKISGLTLRGGSLYVLDVGPGTVQNCRIEDVTGTLQYDPAVLMPSSTGKLHDSRIVRVASARAVEMSEAAELKRCYIDINGTSQNDDPAILVTHPGVTIEADTLDFQSGLSHTRFGIEMGVNSGDATVHSNYFFNANKGIWVNHSSTGSTSFKFNIFDGCTYGIYMLAGSGQTIERNTFYRSDATCSSGSYGLLMTSNVLQSNVDNNLFINLETGMVCGGGTVSYSHNVYSAGACTSGTASSCSLTTGEMALKEALLCLGRESAVEYFTQRIDSEAAPGNNGWNEIVGAKDIECAWGTLARSTTVPYGKSVLVLEDVVVPSTKSLTLNSGSILRFDSDDDAADGTDDELNELVVEGSLTVSGSSGSKVQFKSSAASPAEGSWYGIDARTGSSLNVSHADIRHAVYGLLMRGGTGGTNSVSNSTFASNEIYDILCGQGSAATPSITDNSITVGGGTGIRFEGAFSSTTVSDNTISGNSSSVAGIDFGYFGSTSTPTLTDNYISGLSLGSGIRLRGGNATLTENEVYNNQYGIHVTGGTGSIGTSSSSSDNSIGSNAYGIYVEATGCTFGPVTIRNNYIFANSSTGVAVQGTDEADLGTSSDYGNNWFDSNYYYSIRNFSSCGTVSARGNYFGECPINPETAGSVDTSNQLCTEPAGGVDLPTEPVAAVPIGLLRSVWPNPTRGAATVTFEVTGGPVRAEFRIFDVGGRLVRTLATGEFTPGTHDVVWDGRLDSGGSAPAGLYFVRLALDDRRESTRLLVLR